MLRLQLSPPSKAFWRELCRVPSTSLTTIALYQSKTRFVILRIAFRLCVSTATLGQPQPVTSQWQELSMPALSMWRLWMRTTFRSHHDLRSNFLFSKNILGLARVERGSAYSILY